MHLIHCSTVPVQSYKMFVSSETSKTAKINCKIKSAKFVLILHSAAKLKCKTTYIIHHRDGKYKNANSPGYRNKNSTGAEY